MRDRQKRKIIVVDDDQNICSLITHTLEAKGLEVIIVSNPEKVVEKIRQTDPDLIFINILSFGPDGFKICESIYSTKKSGKTPVIILIPYSGELDQQYAASIGIVDVMIMPFNTDELMLKTANVLGEDIVMSGTYGSSQESSAEEKLRDGERPGDLNSAANESLRVASESLEEEKSEQRADYKNEGTDKDTAERGYTSYNKAGIRHVKQSFLFYAAASLVGIIIGVMLFTDIGGKLMGVFSGEQEAVEEERITDTFLSEEGKTEEVSPRLSVDKPEELSEKGPDREEKITDTLPAEKVSPLSSIDKPEKEITSKEEPVKPEIVRSKRRPPEKSDFLKKTGYSLQVGAFESEKNALLLTDKLKRKGYNVFILKELWFDNKIIHRVLVGKFDRREEAMEYSKILHHKERIKSFVYSD